MAKRNFTDEEKKILKSGLGTILWKILFWPAALFELLVAMVSLPEWSEYGVAFVIISIPFVAITYMSYRKQLFWKEEKQREYIQKVLDRKAGRPRTKQKTVDEMPYKATPYASMPNERPKTKEMLVAKKEEQPKAAANVGSITVDFHIERSELEIPPLQGNYAKTVFFWAFRKPSPIRRNGEYASYFLYECGIRDCVDYHKKLISEGYFVEATPNEKLDALKVPELKEILVALSKPVSGKKAELIDRIIENAESDLIEKYCPDRLYVLSAEGQKFLDEHEAYAELHKHSWGITWMEYDSCAKPGEAYINVVWRIINDRLKTADLQEQRNLYLSLHQILREKGNMSDALEMLLKVFYLDFSGIEGENCYHLYREGILTKKRLKEDFQICILLAPGNIKSLSKCKDFYDSEMIDQLYTWQLPMNICSKELFKEIIESGINDCFEEELVNTKLRRSFNRMVDAL
ncbi:SAP domain-containing protein [Lachnospiraceae bacterium LCP25S3_G4]